MIPSLPFPLKLSSHLFLVPTSSDLNTNRIHIHILSHLISPYSRFLIIHYKLKHILYLVLYAFMLMTVQTKNKKEKEKEKGEKKGWGTGTGCGVVGEKGRGLLKCEK